MDQQQAFQFLLAQAAMARVAGMTAENEWRKARGEDPPNGADQFFSEAMAIEACAYRLIQS